MIGEYIQNYRIDELISEGGMGSVYKATHIILRRKAAIKMLNPLLIKQEGFKQRFRQEASTLAALDHPNIVSLYDYLETDSGIFMILEYVEGDTLDQYIDTISGPIPENRLVDMFSQMLDAVGHAHDRNIIHRDLKPSNFIVTTDNKIKVLDFGIAKTVDYPTKNITKTGTKIGTALYMSPQQVRGQILDRRTDIYSLGVTLFQMLTGQYPYDQNSPEYDIYTKIVNEKLPDPQEFYVGISEKMKQIIYKATEKRPLDRYQSCAEFKKAIRATQKRVIQNPLTLKTRIIEPGDEQLNTPIINKNLIRNLILVVTSVVFILATVSALYLMIKKEERHVIANTILLKSQPSEESEKIETLDYGETVKVLSKRIVYDQRENQWLYVKSRIGNDGYVQKDKLVEFKIYEQINAIFSNEDARSLTPLDFKKKLRFYFVKNSLFRKQAAKYNLYAGSQVIGFNSIVNADFDSNNNPDFACVLRDTVENHFKLVFIFDDNREMTFNFDEEIKIRKIEKGREGGGWYLGKQLKKTSKAGKKYIINHFDFLEASGVLVYKAISNKNLVFVLDTEEAVMRYYEQPQ